MSSANFEIEGEEDVSHSRMCKRPSLSRALRSDRSFLMDRTAPMTVFDGSDSNCRTNSRPRPRLAPVMAYTGILRRDGRLQTRDTNFNDPAVQRRRDKHSLRRRLSTVHDADLTSFHHVVERSTGARCCAASDEEGTENTVRSFAAEGIAEKALVGQEDYESDLLRKHEACHPEHVRKLGNIIRRI
jgi:hypothetical protein